MFITNRIPSKASSSTFKVLNLWCEFHEVSKDTKQIVYLK